VLKTVKKEELHFFRHILQKYVKHMTVSQRHSLLPRFYALLKLKYTVRSAGAVAGGATGSPTSGGGSGGGGDGAVTGGGGGSRGPERIFRLVVMNNLFDIPRGMSIHHRFDLKGSTRNRHIPPAQATPGRVLLDLNWNEQGLKLRLGPQQKALFMQQLKHDCSFLRSVDVMDHSLLLGIAEEDDPAAPLAAAAGPAVAFASVDAAKLASPLAPDYKHGSSDGLLSTAWQCALGGVRAFDGGEGGPGNRGPPRPRSEIYFMGIIDILQRFDAKKKLEVSTYACGSRRLAQRALRAVAVCMFLTCLSCICQCLSLSLRTR